MNTLYKSLLPILFPMAAGCVQPADTLYFDGYVKKKAGVVTEESVREAYATNLPKDEKEVDAISRRYHKRLGELPLDVEFLEYKEADGVSEFRAKLSGDPRPLYAVTNLIKNRGDFWKWYLARLENDKSVVYHKVYNGLKNRLTGAETSTGLIYMLELPDGLSVVALADEKDAETLRQRGIGNYIILPRLLDKLPDDVIGQLKKLGEKPKEQIKKELKELENAAESGYRSVREAVLSTPGYGWPVTEAHREAAKKLKKLNEDGRIRRFELFRRVRMPGSDRYYDFVIIDSNGKGVAVTEQEVPDLARDPEGFIRRAKKYRIAQKTQNIN